MLTYSRPYGVAPVMERAISRTRQTAEVSEREAVATEIDRLVRASGLSRAEFASRIGTSASRLSTYVTGKVTPSAALLVRMRRAIGHEFPQAGRHTEREHTGQELLSTLAMPSSPP